MTNSIKTHWSRALVAVFGVVLCAMVGGCDAVFSGGPCTCNCVCTSGASFCGSGGPNGDPAGSAKCMSDCHQNTATCFDESISPPPPPPPPPTVCTDQTPSLFGSWMFCATCPDFPAQEFDLNGYGCTEPDAEAQADATAKMEVNDDCTVALNSCSAE